jgi:alpha-tubulin suppressor-like RCC1 family protein
MSTTKGVWKLQEVRDQILNNEWVQYDGNRDPGQLWAWGFNCQGQLGDGTNGGSRSSPIQIPGTNWISVEGREQSSFYLAANGTLCSTGRNYIGELGVNDTVHRSSPVPIPGTTWNSISSANDNSHPVFATKTDNTLWVWGGSRNGTSGTSVQCILVSSPIQIPGTTWSSVSGGYTHVLAKKTDGTLWSWGQNYYGELGNSRAGVSPFFDCANESSPVQIPGTTWGQVAAGRRIGFATKTDGTLWGWGGGNYAYGGLGVNNITRISSPVQIPGTNWTEVSTIRNFAVARKTDGTVWAWGQNSCGQLGQGNTTVRSSPVQIPGTNWNQIRSNFSHVLARKTDGTLWGWGDGTAGRLAENISGTNRSSPIQIPGTTWIDIGRSGLNSLARKSN